MTSELKKPKSQTVMIILFGVAIGVGGILLAMMLFAALIYFFELDRAYAEPLATLSLGIGCFAAAFYVAKKTDNRGIITGAAVGVITFALITAASLIVCRTGLTLNTLFHFIIIMLSSLIGGILGVNIAKNRKFI